MNDGPVYDDYKQFQNYDAGKQAHNHIQKSIILSVTCTLIPLGIVYYIGLQTYMPILAFFISTLFLVIFITGPIIFYYGGRNTTKMNMAHQGYNVDWQLDREKIFGYDTYHILRADPGILQSEVIGFNGNPFAVSTQTLQNMEDTQRKDGICEVCSEELFENHIFDYEGAYFVEKRKRLWVFGVPVKERILGWDAYCAQHKPKMEQH